MVSTQDPRCFTNSKELGKGFPLFIVGSPRSGTTLLRKILKRHPKIFVPGETGVFLDLFPFSGLPLLRKNHSPIKRRALLLEVLMIPRYKDIFGEKVVEEMRSEIMKHDLEIREFVDMVFQVAMSHIDGKKYWAEKTPSHALHIDSIRRVYPNATIIYLLRHPCAVVASMMRYTKQSMMQQSWMFDTPSEALDLYLDHYDAWWRFRDETLLWKYEEFVQNPEDHLESLLKKHLNIEYDANMIQPNSLSEIRSQAWYKYTDEAWYKYTDKAIDSSLAECWKTELREEQIAYIETRTKYLLDRHGYERKYGNSGDFSWVITIDEIRRTLSKIYRRMKLTAKSMIFPNTPPWKPLPAILSQILCTGIRGKSNG